MRDLVTANNLSDVYRLHHPKGRHTTNRSAPGTCRRLQRIYIWAPVLKSTHSMVVARFQVPGAIDIGPGKFKLGLHTPDDPKAAWTTTKHRLLPQLQASGSATLARFRRGGSEQGEADHSR
ncbi:BQ2448_27 [Microbotryum intermedium]|uniref:BQ2448_27 protein n=1 Tax=Microbotryum intermedium TaxID=269621 RepID=A0A238FL49_9BASI|nr:BQ2448_27 [Microbotryum intermedium]